MHSLIRWGTTLGLVGSTVLSTFLGGMLKVVALPTEEVAKILQGIPVFTIADPQGAPLVAVAENKQRVTGVFISQKEAQNFFNELKKQKPDVASKVSVQPVSLGEVYKLIVANEKKPDALVFSYVPTPQEVASAKQVAGQDYTGGVPLFVARGGKEKGYLTIEQNKEQVIPFFFEKKQITEMVERFKKDKPDLASTVSIDVVPLENVISTLQSSNDAMLKQIRIVPTEEALQFIRSLSAQQPQKK
ncbi:Tic22 family protein [Synechocystis sp. LKSZ1]|uniref:Tic22 family protein n=1 Tax=Synechocystis sp. LKSZ1 TaxID=3144951 RepID=UPI00336BE45B